MCKRRKSIIKILSVVLCGMLLASMFSLVPASAAPKASTTEKVSWPEGPKKEKLSCKSAIVMELSSGLILYNKNMHKKRYPASITKILTAYLAAENCSMGEEVTFSREAAYSIHVGDSTIYTDPGEKLTMEQCLYAIMLQSANEVCYGVAEHVAGSEKKFVKLMNEKVRELGLTDTHFNNTNGLPDTKHYTSAHDMAVIARTAMQNPSFRAVAGVRSYVMPKTNTHKKRFWTNHHEMINGDEYPQYEYKYCIGGKTGYTNAARNTLVTYAQKDGMELVCVVMKSGSPKNGEPNEYTDTISLLNFGFEKYQKYAADENTDSFNESLFNYYGSYFDTEQSPVHLARESSVILPKGVPLSKAKQKITYDEGVTLKEGDNVIGRVTYTYGGKTVGSTDILYTKAAQDAALHLDGASRQIVNQEIQDIKATQKSDEKKANLWKKLKGGVVAFLSFRIVQVILLAIAIACGVLLLVWACRHIRLPSFRRRRRTKGSRGGRRERYTVNRSRGRSRRAGRRRRSKDYVQKGRTMQKKQRPGVSYHKKHKNTRESFGKNFFDF